MMINGVLMNDMEWGGIYWLNWVGLSDVICSMQVQCGLGVLKVVVFLVGGFINIVINIIDVNKGGFVFYGMGNDGLNKILFKVFIGLIKLGWVMIFLGGKIWVDGYIQGINYEVYNWFVNIIKCFNDNYQLLFIVFVVFQWYNQCGNKDGFIIEGWQEVVKNYMNGEKFYCYNFIYGFGLNG